MLNKIQKVAEAPDRYIFEMRTVQSAIGDVDHTNARIYSLLSELIFLYDFIYVINLDTDTVETFNYDGLIVPEGESMTIEDFRKAFAKKWVHPKDRERYLTFTNTQNMLARLNQLGRENISERFLTYNSKLKKYEWKLYTEMMLPHNGEHILMELIKTSILEEQDA
jgi:hypothetical protein